MGFLKDEKGFTGLEAAIVLIAFVVVAAVFSYVMLGAGFYTTQKSQEVVHTGVQQASSSIALAGDVIVEGGAGTGGTGTAGNNVTFYLTSTAGGTPVDLEKTIITYSDDDEFTSQEYVAENAGPWIFNPVIPVTKTDNVNLVEIGDKYKVVFDLTAIDDPAVLTSLPVANEKIKIEVKPPEGAVLVITRTMPPSITDGQFYTVY
jgi:flagellin FlaB